MSEEAQVMKIHTSVFVVNFYRYTTLCCPRQHSSEGKQVFIRCEIYINPISGVRVVFTFTIYLFYTDQRLFAFLLVFSFVVLSVLSRWIFLRCMPYGYLNSQPISSLAYIKFKLFSLFQLLLSQRGQII